ncbi:MAG: ATP-binding protein [bacterium]|jgi:hypothetical protein
MNAKEDLLNNLRNTAHQYTGEILVKGIFFRFNGAFYPLRLFFIPVRNKQTNLTRGLNYGDLLLAEDIIDLRTLEEFILALGEGTQLKILSYDINVPMGYFRETEEDQQIICQKYRGYSNLTDFERKYLRETRSFPKYSLMQWPSKKYLFKVAPDSDCLNSYHKYSWTPLPLKETLPVLPEYHTAVNWWLGNDFFYLNDWTLAFYVPDFRARIRSVRFGRDRLIINAEEGLSTHSYLGAKYYLEYENRSAQTGEITFSESNEIQIHEELRRFYIVIFDKNTPTVSLDYRDYDWRHQYADQDISDIEYEEENTEYWIAGGENDVIEFKLEIENDNTKKEFIETVCSFANSKGGRIFIGVDNNGNIKGLTASQTDRYCKMIHDLIRNWVEPQVQAKIEAYEIREKKIVMVNISIGQIPPYNYKDHGVYMRSGSTDRLATREELLSLIPDKR